jgi:cytidylate kinase
MYRAVGLLAAEAGLPLRDEAAVGALAEGLALRFGWRDGRLRVWVGDRDVTEAIRTEPAGQGASAVATLPRVRRALVDRQRALAAAGGVVMDGRDIGTVVLPDADLKVFLDAVSRERARRRHAELTERGVAADLDDVQRDIEARDLQDRSRATAPLRCADDAVRLDSTHLEPHAVVAELERLARVAISAAG